MPWTRARRDGVRTRRGYELAAGNKPLQLFPAAFGGGENFFLDPLLDVLRLGFSETREVFGFALGPFLGLFEPPFAFGGEVRLF